MGNALKDVTETATHIGRDVKHSLVEFGKSAGRKIDTARVQTGDALSDAAASVRHASSRIDALADNTASSLDAAAKAVKKARIKNVGRGVRRFAGNHLTATFLAATILGYFVGSTIAHRRA